MSTYSDYFDIDEGYYPEINPNSISDPSNRWDRTFPHKTFVELLQATERMLARENNSDKKGIWIEGAYGTGKSRVAWTLRSLLECSPDELASYFSECDTLRDLPDLRDKLLAHKKDQIVTVYKYGSGEINSIHKLVMTVFEEVSQALRNAGFNYMGERTLRGKISTWLSDETNQQVFGLYMSKPEYCGLGSFAGKSIDDIVAQLNNLEQTADVLIGDILKLAEQEGVRAFDIDMDDLTAWIKDVIEENRLKAIVFIWDEFSSYFKNNRTTLDEFQKLAELSNEKPFYLMIVTHMSQSLVSEGDQAFKIVRDRFIRREIEMPDTVAFDLIGHNALKVKPVAQDEWNELADDLNSRMVDSRKRVSEVVGAPERTLTKLLPIHPMAALLLKYISTVFASNQRSMFNFIKNPETDDLQAFQWFINHHGPDDGDLLTIDYLWNFFYEKGTDENTSLSGRSNLDFMVATILDAYPNNEGKLHDEERRVLKTILMMQAISQKINNSVEIFRPNDKNINLAFEGDPWLEANRATNIAKNILVKQGILYIKPTDKGDEYAVAAVAGDQVQIDNIKRKRLSETKTAKLVDDAQLLTAITLSPSQRTRYQVEAVTVDNFKPTINRIANDRQTFQFRAVVCFARTEVEQMKMRELVKDAAAEPIYESISFIDTSATLLGQEPFERWATFVANEEYWRSKDGKLADNQGKEASNILLGWRTDIANGSFEVRCGSLVENCPSSSMLIGALERIVLKKYPLSFDSVKVSENFFSSTAVVNGAKLGISEDSGGVFQQNGVSTLLQGVRGIEKYWEDSQRKTLAISKLKTSLDKLIATRLAADARVSISEIFDYLTEQGFMPCNLYAYLTGFLLKEYAQEPYRFGVGTSGDDGGRMTVEKLAEFIGEYIKHKGVKPIRNYHEKYIEVMTQEQKLFVDFARDVFDIPDNLSVEQAAAHVRNKLKDFGYPIWCLKYIDDSALDGFIDKLSAIACTKTGENVPALANEFGRMLGDIPTAAQNLSRLFTQENGSKAIGEFLHDFEGGELIRISNAIGVDDVLGDVRRQIGAGEALWLWDQETGEDELRKLLTDYRIVERSSEFVGKTNSLYKCISAWVGFAHFLKTPQSALSDSIPKLKVFFRLLADIVKTGDLAHDKRADFLQQLEQQRAPLASLDEKKKDIFAKTYQLHLTGFSNEEIDRLYSRLPDNSFLSNLSDFEKTVQKSASEARANQKKFQLHTLWEGITQSKNGVERSAKHRTPILALVPSDEQVEARKLFGALYSNNPEPKDVERGLEYLQASPSFLKLMSSNEAVEEAFVEQVIGKYRPILQNANEVRDHLEKTVPVSAFSWYGNQQVHDAVRELAKSRYRLGGNEGVKQLIDDMDAESVKRYLKELVAENVEVGIEIINDRGAE